MYTNRICIRTRVSDDFIMRDVMTYMSPFFVRMHETLTVYLYWEASEAGVRSRRGRIRSCLFVLLLLNFWKNWLMTSWIAECLILGVGFRNIYLSFLHTKSLKSIIRWDFQLLVHFFKSLLFSVKKLAKKLVVCSCFWLFNFLTEKTGWEAQTNST
jgi:hypothetical protein